MKATSAKTGMLLFVAAILLVGLVVLTGCEKKSEPAPGAETKDVSAKIEQTTCPVMGGAINENIFTEYQGKKVYFCCPPCAEKFKANPQEYIAKLPQFKD
jgi:YHS domain-containing protein